MGNGDLYKDQKYDHFEGAYKEYGILRSSSISYDILL